jgi:hypothetical protein
MKLTKRHAERRLLSTDLLQAIERKIEAFAGSDSGGPDEAKGMSFQCVSPPELLLEAQILFRGERSGQVMVANGKVLEANQIRWNGITAVAHIAQQTTEQGQTLLPSSITQRRPSLAKRAEPTQQMRIAAQLGSLMQAREVGLKISKKATSSVAIFVHGAWSANGGQALNLRFQDPV